MHTFKLHKVVKLKLYQWYKSEISGMEETLEKDNRCREHRLCSPYGDEEDELSSIIYIHPEIADNKLNN